jgi:hypothetical protein
MFLSDTGYDGVFGPKSRSGDGEVQTSIIGIDADGDGWAVNNRAPQLLLTFISKGRAIIQDLYWRRLGPG